MAGMQMTETVTIPMNNKNRTLESSVTLDATLGATHIPPGRETRYEEAISTVYKIIREDCGKECSSG
jgi:hypothetical protein